MPKAHRQFFSRLADMGRAVSHWVLPDDVSSSENLTDSLDNSASTVAFTIPLPTSLPDAPVHLTSEELDKRFFNTLRAHGYSDAAARSMHAKYDSQQMYAIIRELEVPEHGAEYFTQCLCSPMECPAMRVEELTIAIQRGSREFMRKFDAKQGPNLLLENLRFSLYRVTSLTQEREDFEKLKHLLYGIIKLFNNPHNIGVDQFMENRDSVACLLRSLEYVTNSVRSDIWLLLAGFCVFSVEYEEDVVRSVMEFSLPTKLFFQNEIITELFEGSNIQFKVSYLAFLNTFTSLLKFNERIWCHKHYLPMELFAALVELVDLYPYEPLCKQLALMKELRHNDFLKYTRWKMQRKHKSAKHGSDASSLPPHMVSSSRTSPSHTGRSPSLDTILPLPISRSPTLHLSDEGPALPFPLGDGASASPAPSSPSPSPTPASAESPLASASAPSPSEEPREGTPPSTAAAAPPPPPPIGFQSAPSSCGAPPPPPPMGGAAASRLQMVPVYVDVSSPAGTIYENVSRDELMKPSTRSLLELFFSKKKPAAPAVDLTTSQLGVMEETIAITGLSETSEESSLAATDLTSDDTLTSATDAASSRKSSLVKERVEPLAARGPQGMITVSIAVKSLEREGYSSERLATLLESDEVSEEVSSTALSQLEALFPKSGGMLKYGEEGKRLSLIATEEMFSDEAYMARLWAVENIRERIDLLALLEEIPFSLRECQSRVKPIAACCQKIASCDQLKRLMQFISVTLCFLKNPSSTATCVRLNALSKVTKIKTRDNRKSLLHVIIGILATSSDSDLLDLRCASVEELEEAKKCAEVFETSFADLKNVAKMMELCELTGIRTEKCKLVAKEVAELRALLDEQVLSVLRLFSHTPADHHGISSFFDQWISFFTSFAICVAYFREEECPNQDSKLAVPSCPRLAQVRADLMTHSPQRPLTSSKSMGRLEGNNVPEMLNQLLSPATRTQLHTVSERDAFAGDSLDGSYERASSSSSPPCSASVPAFRHANR